jgi:hypothetical protein
MGELGEFPSSVEKLGARAVPVIHDRQATRDFAIAVAELYGDRAVVPFFAVMLLSEEMRWRLVAGESAHPSPTS